MNCGVRKKKRRKILRQIICFLRVLRRKKEYVFLCRADLRFNESEKVFALFLWLRKRKLVQEAAKLALPRKEASRKVKLFALKM